VWVLAAFAGPARAVEPAAGAVPVEYAMTVGADGKVMTLVPGRELPEGIDRWIRQQVARYTFVPATLNGAPQRATTTLYVTLGSSIASSGKHVYRIHTIATGPDLKIPSLFGVPRSAGGAYFIATYDAAGRITGVAVDEANDVIGGREFRKWGMAMIRAARVQPESVAGMGVPGEVLVPLVYCPRTTCPKLAPAGPEGGNDLNGRLLAKSVLRPQAPAGDG
jgi:hypothetical protein